MLHHPERQTILPALRLHPLRLRLGLSPLPPLSVLLLSLLLSLCPSLPRAKAAAPSPAPTATPVPVATPDASAAPLLARISAAEQKANTLSSKLQACRASGHDITSPDAALAVAELFCRFMRHDAAAADLRSSIPQSLAYIEQLLDSELSKADVVLAGKASYPSIPPWRGSVGVSWHDGGLWCGGEPVFLSGFNWDDGEAAREPALLKRLGVNLVDGMLRGTMRPDGTFRDDWFRSGPARTLRQMADSGFAVDCLLDPAAPRWLTDATPGMTAPGYGHYGKEVFDHPRAAAYREQFLTHFVPLFAAQPACFAVDLANEPAHQGPSALMLENWRAWLRRKYGDLATLNKTWGTNFASFESISRYPSMADPMKGPWDRTRVDFSKPGVRGMHYDWCAFNNERVTGYFRSMADRIHAAGPRLAVHVKIMMGLYFTGSTEARGWPMALSYHTFGIDPEALAQCSDLLGCDLDLTDLSRLAKPSRFYGSEPYVNGWLNAGLAADFLKSLAPEKPFYNSELHAVERVDETDIQPSEKEHIETALWLAHLHGMNANLLWYWGRGADGSVPGRSAQWFKGSLLQQPWVVQGYAQEMLNLRRFVRPVMAFPRAPRPVRLLYSEASAIQDVHYLDALRDAYEALNFLGVSIGLVTERQLAEGGAPEGTRLLIVPNARYVEDATVAALQAARARGVRVGLLGEESLIMTPIGARRADVRIPGVERTGLATPRAYHAKFDGWFKSSGIERDLTALDGDGRPAWGIETRTAREGKQRLAYLVNLRREPVKVTLQWKTGNARLRDWRTDQEIGRELTLQPRQVVFGGY